MKGYGIDMPGECHMHIFMNGRNYRKAVELHSHGVQDKDIREKLSIYRQAGVLYLRDGGDALGVSARAAQLAPEYGITYRTPLFAIHRNGHYGSIVGHGFDNWKEYHDLVKSVKRQGGDFIKIMISGIMDFSGDGSVSEEPLSESDIREMIRIAHEEGFAVMIHANGARTMEAAALAGADSIEHGNFVDEACLKVMAEQGTIWVPTYVTITNLIGCGRFDDAVLEKLRRRQGQMIRRGFELGVKIAAGSDAGAYCVMHGQGIHDEYVQMRQITEGLFSEQELYARLADAEEVIKQRFVAK